MNKLDVAFDLIKLLNERKKIDTKMVAQELQVSVRTAQRYLLELSRLPCVLYDDKSRTYAVNSDYKLADTLVNGKGNSSTPPVVSSVPSALCMNCSAVENRINGQLGGGNGGQLLSNRQVLDKLVSLINKRLALRRCSFP